MKVKISKGTAKGYVEAPPSKSMAHRMLICAGLSKGTSKISCIEESEDILATIDCLEAMGVKCQREGSVLLVTGIDITKAIPHKTLMCRESGSTLRFFIPICLATGARVKLKGSERLMERPLGVYEEICRVKGMIFSRENSAVEVEGPLEPGVFTMAGNVSSQFISGMLFALPLLNGDSKIKLIQPVESRPYINMTMSAMTRFGIDVKWEDDETIAVSGNQNYHSTEVSVEGDYSNAAFFEALNFLGGQVEVGNLNIDSIQGDMAYKTMFPQLESLNPSLDISDCPDLGPILFALSAAKNGGVFTGTKRLAIKESDRRTTMAQELSKFGVQVDVADDTTIVHVSKLRIPNENLYGHNDHRVVMSLAVLSTLTGGVIEGAEAVKKSFPDFFEKLKDLGIDVEILED